MSQSQAVVTFEPAFLSTTTGRSLARLLLALMVLAIWDTSRAPICASG
jgi:hypothetical protein